MPGYPKIWTFIRHEWWFKKLKASQRGAILEMLLMVKEQQDNGHVVVNSVTTLASELSINRKVMSQLLSEMTAIDPPPLVIINQQPLDIYFPKYLKWQKMTLKDAIKHAQSSGSFMTHPLPEAEQSKSRVKAEQTEEALNVDNSKKELKPTDHVLYAQWKDWREQNLLQLEALAINFPGVPSHLNKMEFVKSVIEDVERQICDRPEKFKSKNFMAILKGYLNKQAELGKLGDYGLVEPMSYEEEQNLEDKKREGRVQTSSFGDGPGVKT